MADKLLLSSRSCRGQPHFSHNREAGTPGTQDPTSHHSSGTCPVSNLAKETLAVLKAVEASTGSRRTLNTQVAIITSRNSIANTRPLNKKVAISRTTMTTTRIGRSLTRQVANTTADTATLTLTKTTTETADPTMTSHHSTLMTITAEEAITGK